MSIERIEKKVIWVNDKGTIKPFSTVAVIPAGTRFKDKELERFITNHTTLEQVSNYFTEVLKPNDPRSSSQKFTEAMKVEIDGLMSRGAFKIVESQTLPSDANILGARFVLAIKNVGTAEEKHKARYVVQGHKDS